MKLSHIKKQSEWERFGFGLLWIPHYQKQITNLIHAIEMQEKDVDPNIRWADLIKEEELE